MKRIKITQQYEENQNYPTSISYILSVHFQAFRVASHVVILIRASRFKVWTLSFCQPRRLCQAAKVATSLSIPATATLHVGIVS